MNVNGKTIRKPILAGVLTGISAICLSFQNCSQVNFETAPSLLERFVCDDAGNCLMKGSAILTAGVDLPPLKMFVVVDNSYTMKANQFNLASNFDEMFAANNSANLTPFDTTAYLINTAQHSYGYGSTTLASLNNTLLPMSALQLLTPDDFNNQNRPIASGGLLNGRVAGDVIGYRIALDNDHWTFLPAPVLGFNGGVVLSDSIRKPANQDSSNFRTEFQERLRLFNPDYSPDNAAGRFFPETQDLESAMCATARILRNPSSYLQNGDQSVFLMITDENEADPTGKDCVQSVFKTAENVVDAYCEERGTTYVLTTPNCVGQYTSGYAVDYKYPDTVPVSITIQNAPVSITHKPAVSTTYKQTKVSFNENGYNANIYSIQYKRRVYQSQTTKIDYCVAEIRDGVKVDQCSGVFRSIILNGNYASSQATCNAKALEVSAGLAITSSQSLPVCTFNPAYTAMPKGQNCDTSLSTCQVTYSAGGTFPYTGFITSQAAANLLVRNYLASAGVTDPYDGLADDAIPASAATYNVTSTVRVVGTCPTGLPVGTCTASPVAKGPYVRKGDFTDSAAECQADAKKINTNADAASAICVADITKTDTAITSCSGIADCTVNYSSNFVTDTTRTSCPATFNSCTVNLGTFTDTTKTSCGSISNCTVNTALKTLSATLSVPFVSGQYLGPILSVGAACSAGIQGAVQTAQAKYRPGTDPCTIKTVNTTTAPLNPGTMTCAQAASNQCDTADNSGARRFCSSNETPRTAQTPVPIREELNCASKCGDSKLNYCQGIAGATPTTLIADVIATAAGFPAGYTCAANITKTPLAAKKTLLASAAATACTVDANGIPNYPDAARTSAPYQTNLPIVEHVSGSVRATNGSFSPAKSLKDYIISRSSELFGEGFQPIVSTFVRQPADGPGIGGSVGTDYIALSTAMNGQSTSVISGDYGGPLRELSGIIKDRVQRAFVINQLSPTQLVRRVWMWNKGTSSWDEMQATDFTAFGKTVVIAPGITFEQGDKIRVEYW